MLGKWLRLFRPSSRRGVSVSRPTRAGRRLQAERLEDRAVPAIAYAFTLSDLSVVNGDTGASDTITITDNAGTVEVNGVPVAASSADVLGVQLTGDFAGAADDTFALASVTSTQFTSLVTVTITGGSGTDTLQANDTNHSWYLTGTDGGPGSTVVSDSDSFVIVFDSVGNLTGGTGSDSFILDAGIGLTGTVNGGGGSDTLDYSAYVTPVVVDLSVPSATNMAAILSIENASGGSGDDLLTGNASANVLKGNLGNDTLTTSGAGGDLLDGGGDDDLYQLTVGGGSTTLSDFFGNDTISFAGAAVGVSINLDLTGPQVIAAGNTVEFLVPAEMETFIGSPQNDIVTVIPLYVPRFIDGGNPILPTLPGDTLILDNTAPPLPVAPTGQTFTYTGPGSGIYSSNEYADVTYTSIETFSSTSPIPNLVINATAANRDFRVVRNGATVEIRDITNPAYFPGVPYFVYGYASFDTLTINGRDSDSNRVILDFGSGGAATNPIQPLGFTFNGDALITVDPVGGTDRLDVAGGGTTAAFDAIATTFSDADSGTGSFSDAAAVSLGSIAFHDLEEYDLSGGTLDPAYAFSTTIQDLTFDFSALAGPTGATFEDSGAGNDGVSRVVTSGGPVQFVPTAFSNPVSRLIVDTTAATADTVLLGDMDNGFSPATLTFTGDSTADVYQLTSAGFLNAAPGVILATATFDLNGVSDTLRWLHDLNDGTSQLALSGGATLTTGNAAIRTYNGVITGTGNLVKQGAGSWTLGGTVSNTYTGSTTVNAGTLYLGKGGGAVAVGGNLVVGDGVGADDADKVQFTTGSGQVISSALVTVHTTGRLDLAGFSNTLAGLTLQSGSTFAATVESGAGTLTLGTGANVTLLASGSGLTPADVNGNLALAAGGHTFTVADGTGALDGTGAAADTDLLVNAVVSGTGALTKTGPGRLQLNGANTYAGTTTVNQGVLHLTGSLTGAGGGVVLAGPTTVLSGGTSGVLHGAGRGVTVAATATNATIRDLLRVRNTTAGSTGVLVQAGGSVRLVNNTGPATTDGISGHAVNVDVSGASAFLQGNKINGTGTSGSVGLRLQGGAVVDAGQVGGGYDFTGLRLTQANPALANGSTGGNVFGEAGAMYTAGTATAGGAIRDLNTNGLNAAAGPQGAPFDAYAQNNSFNGLASVPANYVAIENLIRHDYDSSPLGFVNYVTPPAGGPVLIVDGDGALLFYSVTPTAAKNNSWDQRSMIRRVRMSFSDFVFIEMSALSLTRGAGFEATGGAVSPTTTVSRVGPVVFDPTGAGTGRYFNYDFGFGGGNVEASGSLVDGKYTLAIDETKIQASVSSAVFSDPSLQIDPVADQAFHRLFGDHNGDQLVTSVDQAIFTPSYRSIRSQAKYVEYFDFDNDGDIDLADQTQFNRRLNRY